MRMPGDRVRALRRVLTIVLGFLVVCGCAQKAERMEMNAAWSAGLGAGSRSYDPKDRQRFYGEVDDGDTSIRLLARVHGAREAPQRLLSDPGKPVTVPNGPFGEVGYSDLGDTDFNGTWTGTGTPTPDSGTVSAKAMHAAAGYSYPVARRIGVFGRVGYAFWDVDEDEVFGGVPESNSASGQDFVFGGGVDVGLTEKLLLELDWSRYMNVGEKEKTGEGDVDAISATLFFRF